MADTVAPSTTMAAEPAGTFPGNSEIARLCRGIDWGRTSLGSVDRWPDALRVAVRTILECPFPVNLWCGPDMVLIYNDAYRVVLGAKHPRALGRPGTDAALPAGPQGADPQRAGPHHAGQAS